MRFSLDIKPFKDYWLNCRFNIMFSILTSLEPSYRLAAFQNNYSYKIYKHETPDKTKVEYIILKAMVGSLEELNKNFSTPEPINFKFDRNYCDFLKELLRKRELVTIGVDLFYWIPNSTCWNTHHWEHYSLIDGYDDEKRVFYVLDENAEGYDLHEIPEERFLIAVHNSPLEPHGYKYRILNNIAPYKFSIDDAIYNAKRLRDELGAIKFDFLWKLSDKEYDEGYMRDLFSMYIFQIMNRHIANQYLFQTVQNEVHGAAIPNSLEQYCQDLYKGWKTLRNILVKTFFSDYRLPNIIDVNERCKNLFYKECEMWDVFLLNIT